MAGGLILRRIEDYLKQQPDDAVHDVSTGSNKKAKTATGSKTLKGSPTWYRPAYHITGYGNGLVNPNDSVKAKTGASLEFNLVNGQVDEVSMTRTGFAKVTMSYTDICSIASLIDELYIGPSYREVLFKHPTGATGVEPRFKKLYGVKSVALPTKYGKTQGTANVSCMACYYCGLYLPIDLIEVDHWYEKVQGQMGAVIKVLRATASGLTVEDASGKRAAQYVKGVKQITEVPTRNTGKTLVEGRINVLRRNYEAGTKQSLSDEGLLFFSLAYGAFYKMNHGPEFFRHFVHSLVNLAPVCGICNKLKNNRLAYDLRK